MDIAHQRRPEGEMSSRIASRLLISTLSATLAPICHGQPGADGQISAEEMASKCKPIVEATVNGNTVSFEQTFATGICWGAFSSIQRETNVAAPDSTTNAKPALGICLPPNSTLTQLIKIFYHYTEQHPQVIQYDYTRVALTAFYQDFPCNNSS